MKKIEEQRGMQYRTKGETTLTFGTILCVLPLQFLCLPVGRNALSVNKCSEFHYISPPPPKWSTVSWRSNTTGSQSRLRKKKQAPKRCRWDCRSPSSGRGIHKNQAIHGGQG